MTIANMKKYLLIFIFLGNRINIKQQNRSIETYLQMF